MGRPSIDTDAEGNVIVQINYLDWEVKFNSGWLESAQPKPETYDRMSFSADFYYKLPEKPKWPFTFIPGICSQVKLPDFVKKVIIPKDYRVIRERAFSGKGIEEIIFEGDSSNKSYLNKIGQYAFANCVALKKVTFSETDKYVDIHAGLFQGCKSLKSIDLTNLLVKTIPSDCFHSSGLENIIFSDKILGIGKHAFDNCSLSEIVLPENLDNIGERAFHMNKLTKVTFPETLKVIGQEAFAYNQLATIDISGSSIYKIDTKAFFSNCLKELNLSYFVSVIGCKAFDANPLLTFSRSDYPFLIEK